MGNKLQTDSSQRPDGISDEIWGSSATYDDWFLISSYNRIFKLNKSGKW